MPLRNGRPRPCVGRRGNVQNIERGAIVAVAAVDATVRAAHESFRDVPMEIGCGDRKEVRRNCAETARLRQAGAAFNFKIALKP
jgi:hypothetical protein